MTRPMTHCPPGFGTAPRKHSALLPRYQSTIMGSYQTVELIDTFINYQESIKRCICIVFDPQQSESGALALRAVRLREAFVELHKAGGLTAEKLKAANISYRDIFEEIPLKVHNSSLGKAVIASIEPQGAIGQPGSERLSLTAAAPLERSLAFLNDCLEDIVTEQQKVCPAMPCLSKPACPAR